MLRWLAETMVWFITFWAPAAESFTFSMIANSLYTCNISKCLIQATERTLKTWRDLSSSSLQLAIVPLSPFACNRLEIAFRFAHLASFLWMFVTVLRSRGFNGRF